jgi:hypothetical protein
VAVSRPTNNSMMLDQPTNNQIDKPLGVFPSWDSPPDLGKFGSTENRDDRQHSSISSPPMTPDSGFIGREGNEPHEEPAFRLTGQRTLSEQRDFDLRFDNDLSHIYRHQTQPQSQHTMLGFEEKFIDGNQQYHLGGYNHETQQKQHRPPQFSRHSSNPLQTRNSLNSDQESFRTFVATTHSFHSPSLSGPTSPEMSRTSSSHNQKLAAGFAGRSSSIAASSPKPISQTGCDATDPPSVPSAGGSFGGQGFVYMATPGSLNDCCLPGPASPLIATPTEQRCAPNNVVADESKYTPANPPETGPQLIDGPYTTARLARGIGPEAYPQVMYFSHAGSSLDSNNNADSFCPQCLCQQGQFSRA